MKTKIPGRIILLSGPSGSGKTTLYKKLLASPRLRGRLVRSVSVTTRRRRPGEKAGRDYLFFSKKDFFSRRKSGFFLEWKKVFENYYGTPLQPVLAFLKKGKNVLLAIDVQGAKMVLKKHPEALKIFVKAPSFSILRQRLKSRGTETKEDLAIRLKTAKAELAEAKNYDYVVINDQVNRCHAEIEKILRNEI